MKELVRTALYSAAYAAMRLCSADVRCPASTPMAKCKSKKRVLSWQKRADVRCPACTPMLSVKAENMSYHGKEGSR